MANLVPLLLLGVAAVALKGKKKKKSTSVAEPEPPDGLPFPPDEEEVPEEETPVPGEPGFSTGTNEGPTPGRPVASGVENLFTGAYPWKILFTLEGDYAAHYYPMGNMGPHEEVARGETPEKAIAAFKFWATNEDRRKRNLPPLLIAKAVPSTNAPQQAGFATKKSEGGGGGLAGN